MKRDAIPTLHLPGAAIEIAPTVEDQAARKRAHLATIERAFTEYAILSKPKTDEIGCQVNDPRITKKDADIRNLQKQLEEQRQALHNYRQLFNPTQQKMIETGKRARYFNYSEMTDARELYKLGPKAYKLLRTKNFPLPAPSSLRRFATEMKRVSERSSKSSEGFANVIYILEPCPGAELERDDLIIEDETQLAEEYLEDELIIKDELQLEEGFLTEDALIMKDEHDFEIEFDES